MADVTLLKTDEGYLIVADAHSQEIAAGWPVGHLLKARVTRLRNPQFHRKGMALLRYAYENCDMGVFFDEIERPSFDAFRKMIALKTGWCEQICGPGGEVYAWPKSMSFTSMDEDEFAQWYSSAIDVLLGAIPNSTRADVERGILEFV